MRVQLGERFAAAVVYAAELHWDQERKDTSIPYLSHLLGAASLVLEQPGTTEDQAIAALLHDALEDQPDRTSVDDISERFGADVAQIVLDCTDARYHPKPPWRHRKVAYIEHLKHVQRASLEVSLADKLHNARAILDDLQQVGPAIWSRFNAPPVAQRWYYTSLAEVFNERLGSPMAGTLAWTVEQITAGIPTDLTLPPDAQRPTWVTTDTLTGAARSLDDLPADPGDGNWWVEPCDTGDPARPVAIFVRSQNG